ncbi:MAG: hypothetical protein Q8S84_06230 [bacterium]|nr:hypothetical protein [bacterium]MDP3381071.1 hypothetical protein [bacterium]
MSQASTTLFFIASFFTNLLASISFNFASKSKVISLKVPLLYSFISNDTIFTSFSGLSEESVFTFAILSTFSIHSTTCQNTECLLSNHLLLST